MKVGSLSRPMITGKERRTAGDTAQCGWRPRRSPGDTDISGILCQRSIWLRLRFVGALENLDELRRLRCEKPRDAAASKGHGRSRLPHNDAMMRTRMCQRRVYVWHF